MNLVRKPGIKQNESTRGPYPDRLPEFPADVKQRFPSMAAVQEQFSQWYFQLRSVLERMQAELQDLIDEAKSAGTSATTDVTTLANQLTALQSSLTGLQNHVASLSTALDAVQDSSTAVNALNELLANHFATEMTHGTVSKIVGETDENAMENKSLGLLVPGYGRFTSLMSRNTIPNGIVVTIPSDYNSVIAAPLNIVGDLFIDGTLIVI